jgi:predicted DNA binding CopG/RHH family protein
MTKKLKVVPKFSTEAEERAFWESHDTADYFDLSKARRVRLPNLKLSTTAISLRLPMSLLERIKIASNKKDVPYQSLIKVWLTEKVEADEGGMHGLEKKLYAASK